MTLDIFAFRLFEMEEYNKIIQDTFLLTESEKKTVLELIAKKDSKTISSLDSYKTTKDASKFYEDMRAVIKGSGSSEGHSDQPAPSTSGYSSTSYSYTPTHAATTAPYTSYNTSLYSYGAPAEKKEEEKPAASTYSYQPSSGATSSYSTFDYSKYTAGLGGAGGAGEKKEEEKPATSAYSYSFGATHADEPKKEEPKKEEAPSTFSYTYGTGGDYSSSSYSYNPVASLYSSTPVVHQEAKPSYTAFTTGVSGSGIHVAEVDESFESLAEKIPLKTLEPNSFYLSCLLGSPEGCNRSSFINMVRAFLPSHSSNEAEIGKLFDAMDQNKDGKLDPTELASGLEKANNNSWNPPVKKIWTALTEKDPEESSVIARKAKEYADPALVESFLKDINIEKENKISFWQLVRSQTKESVYEMYAAINNGGRTQSERSIRQPGVVVAGNNQTAANGEQRKTISKAKLLIKIKRVFNLEKIDPLMIADMFKNVDFDDVNIDNFTEVMGPLNQGIVSNAVFRKTCKELFEFMDLDGNGNLEKEEFLVSLLTLTSGSETDKIKAAFNLFDLDGNGVLSLPEICTYIFSLFLMAKRTDPTLKDKSRKELLDIATATGQKAFKDIDVNNDGIISQEEFTNWVLDKDPGSSHKDLLRAAREKTAGRRGTLASAPFQHDLSQKQGNISEDIEKSGAHSHLIEEVRKDIAFDKIHIKDAMEFLVKNIQNLNAVTKPQFNDLIKKLLKEHSIEVKFPDSFDRIMKLFFTIFDENSDGSLNIQELAAGLHMICGGNKREKISQTIRFYDKDQSNELDIGELTDYFYFTFRLLFSNNCDQSVKSLNPLKVAKATAKRAFGEMKVPLEASISFVDFVKWAEKSL